MDTITNSFWWRMKWYGLRAWFNPRQKWLIKKIPNTWCDSVELVPLCLFEILKNFVEKEEGLESIWGDRYIGESCSEVYRESREPVRKELEEIYEYIKNGRSLLQEELDAAYPTPLDGGNLFDLCDPIVEEDGKTVKSYIMKPVEAIYGMSFAEAYGEVHRLEKLIEDKDTKAMIGIIKNRAYLWT